ncbi:hypothetical protein BV25DRAFT_1775046, partial [Artomyces pyxidatus]
LRTSRFVPVLLGPKLPREDRSADEKNAFCRAMLILFKPWRGLHDLKSPDETWTEAYERSNLGEDAQRVIRNINIEHQCRDARDRINTDRQSEDNRRAFLMDTEGAEIDTNSQELNMAVMYDTSL